MISERSLQQWTGLARKALLVLFALACASLLVPRPGVADTPRVYAIHIDGVISSLTTDRVVNTLSDAEANHATALLIQINSPGGTENAVQEITRALLSATIPIIVYVDGKPSPEALSGAMFITLSANIAAMNPDAKLGPGNPESLSGTTSGPEQQQRLSQIEQFATNIAATRHRNVEAISQAITENDQLTADESLALGLIDKIAPSIEALLGQVNGTEVQTLAGPATIESTNARLVWQKSSSHERILEKITDPNVAYVLFSLGATLLVIELFNPGRLIAGIPGIIAMAAAFVAFGNMPVSWLSVGLMTVAFLLLIRELFTPKITLLGPLGIVLYVIGSLTLYRPVRQSSAIVPAVGVSYWVIGVTTLGIVITMLVMMQAIFRVRHSAAPANALWLVGADAIVLEALKPQGVVRVLGQEWTAVTNGPIVKEGEHVRVSSVEAGMLHVTRTDNDFDAPLDTGHLQMTDTGNPSNS